MAVFVIWKYVNPTDHTAATAKNIYENPSFIEKQQALLYISPEAELLEKKEQQGSIVFIDHKGKAKGFPINAVEYGGTVVNGHDVFIDQSNKLSLFGKQAITKTFTEDEYRGLKTGLLPQTKQFYSIYNSGLSKKHDYKMTIRYLSQQGEFETALIPYFVSAAGEEKDHVLLLTQDLITSEFQLRSLQLKDHPTTKLITSLKLKNTGNLDAVSQVISDEEAYYFAASNYETEKYEDINLYRVDKKTFDVQTTPIAQYRSEQETESSLPLTFDNSIYRVNEAIYFMNGVGTIYRYHTKTAATETYMTIRPKPIEPANHAQMQFKNGQIYYVYETKNKEFYLDRYSLDTKKRTAHIEIENLKKYLGDQKKIGLYNLDIITSKK
ncbi:hypothetical protein [Kurthia sibirica]|uniref:Uncharacterized protein n=1 Tax=Kurthia sibirica TaxID=202750 RepID=A0A2U3APL0_9BACL|nr:hypothetical protein [Kurthia sibirica]PWI26446.1 hypothetical protein DEX24_03695 [Kurthia sibirica]